MLRQFLDKTLILTNRSLPAHHNHATPLHLMHLLATFPHLEIATLTKTIDFVHADIFRPLLVTFEKTATIKVLSENFPLRN